MQIKKKLAKEETYQRQKFRAHRLRRLLHQHLLQGIHLLLHLPRFRLHSGSVNIKSMTSLTASDKKPIRYHQLDRVLFCGVGIARIITLSHQIPARGLLLTTFPGAGNRGSG